MSILLYGIDMYFFLDGAVGSASVPPAWVLGSYGSACKGWGSSRRNKQPILLKHQSISNCAHKVTGKASTVRAHDVFRRWQPTGIHLRQGLDEPAMLKPAAGMDSGPVFSTGGPGLGWPGPAWTVWTAWTAWTGLCHLGEAHTSTILIKGLKRRMITIMT
ncbi:hypothetical protein L211DRAFT_850134 [Terfezia boudieri ATCC MYA-4762]|uniref:Uncharacterized protein n=1 Tax=Terfezia boudieri ATCC MYA-4762 TaxID=1051890 RepID=A0A3N4LJU6_9PEZI|nr:hypothetical protein L211DRAFT_850134 [Terfezia boudieri ATCC MYA-4762]